MSQVNLLIVEDNPADSDLIREYVSEIKEFDSNLECVSTLQDAKEFLKKNSVHAILVDLSLPDSRGLETVNGVVEQFPSSATIVLTSLNDANLAMQAIESGAQDYVLKGALNSDVLARVIRHSLQRRKWMVKLAEVQEQFYRSQKMESIGRIASGVAHDFNNQLGSISLLSSLAAELMDKTHPALASVKKIEQAVQRAATLVQKLMVFCRKNSSQPAVFDLYDMIAENKTLFEKWVGADIEVSCLGSKGAYIFADAALIEQAITNLVINARDAMEKGGRLTLTTQVNSTDPKKSVTLSVQDSGCGIPDEIKEKIFEPFFTTKGVGKGTGLGLSMVYGTVAQFGGSLSLESTKDVGTTFTLTFPLASVPAAKEKATPTADLKNKSGHGETILVVDDGDPLREVVEQCLSRAGYKIISAVNGLDALEKIRSTQIHLLVTDMVMPKMGGADLARNVLKQQPHVGIIFMSGYAADEPVTEIDGKACLYLQKPFSSDDLLLKVNQLLSEQKVLSK